MPAGNMLEAFFVSLGWDTRDFDRGRRKIDKDFSDTKDNARKTANDIEAAGKQAASFFRSLRNETVGLFLAFQGASSLKSFLGDLITTAASTDRLAKNMGLARNELYAWQNLAKTNGGTPGDARNAIGMMADQIQSWKLGLQTGNEQNLAGLGLTRNDYTTPDHMLLKIAEAAGKMDRATFSKRLGLLGFSPEMIDLLSKGRGELEKQLEVQRKLATLGADDAKAAEDFQKALASLQTALTGGVLPALTGFLNWFTEFLDANKDLKLTMPEVIGVFGALTLAIAPAAAELAIFVFAALGVINILRRLRGEPPIVITIPRFGGIGGMGTGDTTGGDAGDAAPGSASGMWNFSSLDKLTSRMTGGNADQVFARLIQQESGGRAGVVGQSTPWGRALGASQLLPSTARAMAAKLGVPYNEALLRGKSAEALAYQLKLGRAYFDEGLATYGGDIGKAVMFYHGGPNERMWGPKTHAYARAILGGGRFVGSRAPISGSAPSGTGSTVNIGAVNVTSPDADSFAKKDLAQKLQERGLVVQAARGMSR